MNLDHDPQARLDYQWNWTDWLALGETISSFNTAVLPDQEMTIESSSRSGAVVTSWISGGLLGKTYTLTCHITTSASRQDDRSFTLTVVNR